MVGALGRRLEDRSCLTSVKRRIPDGVGDLDARVVENADTFSRRVRRERHLQQGVKLFHLGIRQVAQDFVKQDVVAPVLQLAAIDLLDHVGLEGLRERMNAQLGMRRSITQHVRPRLGPAEQVALQQIRSQFERDNGLTLGFETLRNHEGTNAPTGPTGLFNVSCL